MIPFNVERQSYITVSLCPENCRIISTSNISAESQDISRKRITCNWCSGATVHRVDRYNFIRCPIRNTCELQRDCYICAAYDLVSRKCYLCVREQRNFHVACDVLVRCVLEQVSDAYNGFSAQVVGVGISRMVSVRLSEVRYAESHLVILEEQVVEVLKAVFLAVRSLKHCSEVLP